jgi:hypothetical protein
MKALVLCARPRLVVVLVVATLALVGGGVAPSVAAAASGGKRVGVVVRGKGASPVEKSVAQALERHHFAAVKGKPLAKAAHALHVGLRDDTDLAAVARRLGLRAIVTGEIRDRGKRAELRAHGADGAVIGEGSWSAAGGPRKLAAAVARGVWSRLGGPLEEARGAARRARPEPEAAPAVAAESAERAPAEPEARAPAAPAPAASTAVAGAKPSAADQDPWAEPRPARAAAADATEERAPPARPRGRAAPDPEAVEVAEGHEAAGGAAPLALDASAGVRVVSRDLSWNRDVNNALQPFSMGNEAAFGFQLAWYPGAHFTSGWASQLGIAASGEYVPDVSAQTMNGAAYPASDSDYWGGLRGRMPLGPADGMLTLGYGQHAFLVRSGTNASRADLAVPDVKYSYLRVGADGRLRLPANFSLLAGVAYRAVLDAGKGVYQAQSDAYFPRLSVVAIDASLAVGFRFLSMFEARLGADLRRYGLNMHPNPATDTIIVSGAVDQYVAYWLDVAVLLDGKPGGVK